VISAAVGRGTLGNSPARLRTASTARLASALFKLSDARTLCSQPERMFASPPRGASLSLTARPERGATEHREDALHDAVFACCDVGKTEAKDLRREFGLSDEATSGVIARLRRHEGNARCGILARALDGYSISRVQRMVSDAAERDSQGVPGKGRGYVPRSTPYVRHDGGAGLSRRRR
jgi:hypothetical protein